MNVYAIQGDLLIQKIDRLPEGLKKRGDNTILEGETTGHRHALVGGEVYEGDSQLYLQVIQPIGEIIHEEHDRIELPAGTYSIVRQREYKNKDATQLVVD